MSAELIRRMAIQEAILRDLMIRFEALPGLPVLYRHIVYGFSTSQVPFTEEEIRAALADLAERGLIASEQTPGTALLPEIGYTIQPDGRDFVAANFPWSELKRFSRRD